MIESYSASSLRLLQKDKEEFKKKYKMSLSFKHTNEFEKTGNVFHKLIFYYLKGFDVSKMVQKLSDDNKEVWENFIQSGILKEKYESVEQTFWIKEKSDKDFFINGRYDAILKEDNSYIIYDWKSENIPQNPEDDIQTVVYLYSASKLFKTENIKIRYVALKKLEMREVLFDKNKDYQKIINDIVSNDD